MKEEKAKKLRSKRRKASFKEHKGEWWCTRLLIFSVLTHFINTDISFFLCACALMTRIYAGFYHKKESRLCHKLLKEGEHS